MSIKSEVIGLTKGETLDINKDFLNNIDSFLEEKIIKILNKQNNRPGPGFEPGSRDPQSRRMTNYPTPAEYGKKL